MTQCLIEKEHVHIWIDGRSGFYAVTVSIYDVNDRYFEIQGPIDRGIFF